MEHIVIGSPVRQNATLNVPVSALPPGPNLLFQLPSGIMLFKGPVSPVASRGIVPTITPREIAPVNVAAKLSPPVAVSTPKNLVCDQPRRTETSSDVQRNSGENPSSSASPIARKKYLLIQHSAAERSGGVKRESTVNLQSNNSPLARKKIVLVQPSTTDPSVKLDKVASMQLLSKDGSLAEENVALVASSNVKPSLEVQRKSTALPLYRNSPTTQKNLIQFQPSILRPSNKEKQLPTARPSSVGQNHQTLAQPRKIRSSDEMKHELIDNPSLVNSPGTQMKFVYIQPKPSDGNQPKPNVLPLLHTPKIPVTLNSASIINPTKVQSASNVDHVSLGTESICDTDSEYRKPSVVQNDSISSKPSEASSANTKAPLVWTTQPHPQYKFKEMFVLRRVVTRADVEAEEDCNVGNIEKQSSRSRRRKTQEHPPESLACPKNLEDILPKSHKYHIVKYEELSQPDQFRSEVRANIFTKEEALQWLQDFEELSGTNFRVVKTFKENSHRLVFKKTFKCHKNTSKNPANSSSPIRRHERHVGCEARLIITVKKPDMKSSADLLLSEYPCVIGFLHNHCHSLTTPGSLRYRRPLPEVREKFTTMFKAKITPSAALRLHKLDVQKKYGDKYFEAVQDGAKCPTLSWCYKLYYDVCGQKVTEGKKKYTRKSSNAIKKKAVATAAKKISNKALVQSLANVNFNSVKFSNGSCLRSPIKTEDCANTRDMVQIQNGGDIFTCDQNTVSDEGERSDNILYEYVSENSEKRGKDLICVENTNIQEVEEVLCHQNTMVDQSNLCDKTGVFHDGNSVEEVIASHEVVIKMEDQGKRSYEFVEGNDSSHTDTVATGLMKTVSEKSECDLYEVDESSLFDVKELSAMLAEVFNDINVKLLEKPEMYVSAVRSFVSRYKSISKGNSTELLSSLLNFGSKDPFSLSNSVEVNDVSNSLENLIDERQRSTIHNLSENPRRKVLVLRMDPNKFNNIFEKVSDSKSKNNVLNV